MHNKIAPASVPRNAEPTPAQIKSAQAEIAQYLRVNANGRAEADREDMAADAVERWRIERQNTPTVYARRVMLDFARKAKRRATDIGDGPIDDPGAGGDWQRNERATLARVAAQRGEVPAVTAVSRVRRYCLGEENALKAAVRIECLKQFRQRLGVEWRPDLEQHVLSSGEIRGDLDEGYAVHEELRLAMTRAVAYAQRGRVGPAPYGLGWWVPQFIEPLLSHAMMEPRARNRGGPKDYKSARHRLVATWDAIDFLGLRRIDGAGARILNATEYAIVWLLGGGWPENLSIPKKGLTPSEVIQSETRAFRPAITDAGRNWLRGPE